MSERFPEAEAELEEYFTSALAIGAQPYDPDRSGGADVDAAARAMAEGDLSVLASDHRHSRTYRRKLDEHTATWRTLSVLEAHDRMVLERALIPRNWSSERPDSVDPSRPKLKIEKPKLDRGALLREVMKREGSNRPIVGVALLTVRARDAFRQHVTRRAEVCRRLHDAWTVEHGVWRRARALAERDGLPMPPASAPVPPRAAPSATEADMVVFLEWEAGRRGEAPSRRLLEAVRLEAANMIARALAAYEVLRAAREIADLIEGRRRARRLARKRDEYFTALLRGGRARA